MAISAVAAAVGSSASQVASERRIDACASLARPSRSGPAAGSRWNEAVIAWRSPKLASQRTSAAA